MATYYVSKNGSDANNGLGPDASAGTNKPWLTIGKALGASGIASGDTVYVGPGVYREAVSVAMTSATVNTSVLGDPGNAQGFKDGSGVLLAPADVIWTPYLTSNTIAPGSSPPLDLNGRDFLTFQYVHFIGCEAGADGAIIRATTTNSINITFRDCLFQSHVQSAIAYVGLADIASNWTLDRCILEQLGQAASGIKITLPTSASADYDTNFQIQNCRIIATHPSGAGVDITTSGAGAFKGGGVDTIGCTIRGSSAGVRTNTANSSTSIPCTVYNCLIMGQTNCLTASASGQIVEDFNRLQGQTARSNVTAGANSIATSAHALMLELGQNTFMGRATQAYLAPSLNSPLLGFGNQAGAPSVDFLNRPRPAGGGSAGVAGATGTATAGAATTLTDGGASWTVNAFTGYTVKITSGTGSGQQRVITSNTGTVLTVPTWTTNPDNTSVYSIYHPGKDAATGAFERHQTAGQETSTVQSGSNAIKIIGPGDHDFAIPVDAAATVISIYCRYDTNHGTGSKPQIILQANAAIGITTETKTMTAGVDTWEQLNFTTQTPTAKGRVVVRVVSRAAVGNGIAYFDTEAGGASSTSGFDYFAAGEPLSTIVAGSAAGIKQASGMDGGMRG